MVKLSESFFKRATALCEHLGEDFGIFPNAVIPSTASHYFTSICRIEASERTAFCMFGYSLWIDVDFFYFCIECSIYKCKRSVHRYFSIDEVAAFLYLVFFKHQTFEL